MNFDKFTERAQETLANAQEFVIQKKQQFIDVEHLIFVLLQDRDSIPYLLFQKLNVDIDSILNILDKNINSRPKIQTNHDENTRIYISQILNNVLKQAVLEAERLKDEFVSTEHLLLAMIDERNTSFYN